MYIKIWTVQRRNVVNHALKQGIYRPNMLMSDFLHEGPERLDLYYFLLSSYCNVNNISCDGLLFGFLRQLGRDVCYIDSFGEYIDVIRMNKAANAALWNHFLRDDYVVVELEMNTDLNLLPIDLNDFQFLMPTVTYRPPEYTQETEAVLRANLSRGKFTYSTMPSGLIQVHLPYMAKENISGIYPIFEI